MGAEDQEHLGWLTLEQFAIRVRDYSNDPHLVAEAKALIASLAAGERSEEGEPR